jgi:hypothetical protein
MPNIAQAKESCHEFIREMADNRSGHDDAGVARQILRDLGNYGQLTPAVRRRLSHWCHTDYVFKRGMPIARRISIALYDKVIPRED